VLHLFEEHAVDFTLFIRGGNVASPQDGELARMVKICDRVKAACVDARDLTGCVADILRSDYIRRSEKIGQTNEDKMLKAFGHADAKCNCPRTMLFLDLKEISGDLLQGLFPGYALPFAFAALSCPLEGMPETVRVCQSIRRCYALRAYITLTQVALRIPLHPDNLIIFHADQKAT